MAKGLRKASENLVSYRFAAIAIGVLFFASLAGWIAQELVPPDFVERKAAYERAWHPALARAVELLSLHDPFHSPWYRLALALFFVVLVACTVSRFRHIALRSLRFGLPSGADALRKRPLCFDLSWRSLAAGARGEADPLVCYGERHGRREAVGEEALEHLHARLAAIFKRRGYRFESERADGGIRFAAAAGRLRSPGTLLLHAGVVVITIGGLLGSLFGWRGMVYLREGERAPIPPDSSASLRVDEFRIVLGIGGAVRDYISTVTILGPNGETLAAGAIEVNHPLVFRGINIHQSSYTMGEGEFARARLSYRLPGESRLRTAELAGVAEVALGDGDVVVSARRFVPDFRVGPQGPFSASSLPGNPALEVEVSSGDRRERGWLFLRHPDFSARFAVLGDLSLDGIEPLYYTGLELSSNPGAPALFAGFAAATIGLFLMYLSNPRVVQGIATREGLLVAGVESRWRASFEREFAGIREAVRREFDESG